MAVSSRNGLFIASNVNAVCVGYHHRLVSGLQRRRLAYVTMIPNTPCLKQRSYVRHMSTDFPNVWQICRLQAYTVRPRTAILHALHIAYKISFSP